MSDVKIRISCAVVLLTRCKVLVIPIYLDTALMATRAINKKLQAARSKSRNLSQVSVGCDVEVTLLTVEHMMHFPIGAEVHYFVFNAFRR